MIYKIDKYNWIYKGAFVEYLHAPDIAQVNINKKGE